ncbi:unnamed protein product [Nippostrongylus brasiliensis]|uniref:CPBP family intramembrane metalloprotease n=1 Tax=Nippostrongylus brasiliensis TaxID=27835 RepID=A0A0N4YK68_NIPBR|nr:unnamed protein product [Nippostrongylus brasiliensis]
MNNSLTKNKSDDDFAGHASPYSLQTTLMWLVLLPCLVSFGEALKILQIVPGFTNSHVLFNYRLAETLK